MRARFKPRRFDKERGCYVYDISFKTGTRLTERTGKIVEAFGLGSDSANEQVLLRDFEMKLIEGDIVYITGESGSGKSVLLTAIKEDLGDKVIDIRDVPLEPDKAIVETVGADLKEALGILSRVGLNDAYLFLRSYRELSEGQKYRYRIARMIDSGKSFWMADEFCSNLDRTTATIVAYNIQKHARRVGATLIVATSHSDLGADLNPTIEIRKGLGDEVNIEYREPGQEVVCSAVQEVVIVEGDTRDYHKLSWLHYRESRIIAPLKIFTAKREGEIVGVIVYCYPGVNASGRRKAVGYMPRISELNSNWAAISRVIVHPKYRSTGLGVRLIKETIDKIGRRHIELIAVMAEYNPFATHAGMKLIARTEPHPSVLRAIESLEPLGFQKQFMASHSFNLDRLTQLSSDEVEEIRRILLRVKRMYYKRIGSSGRPYPTRTDMNEWLETQPLERLAKCLQNLAILGQGKVYLYWSRTHEQDGEAV